ncbi:MAG: hypothetical protein L6R35_006805 [Caloplaca aegaea]|nr:MAG: hypothetical protein L6R35_006805 [Caloplaca aegaea]
MAWIAKGRDETIGLSNATFGDRSWYKVLEGEKLMRAAIAKSVEQKEPKEDLVMRLMELLSRDTLPKLKQNQGLESYLRELRNSILIPPIGGDAMHHISADQIAAGKGNEQVGVEQLAKVKAQQQGLSGGYGTQKQTVVLVGHDGHVTFVERTLFEGAKLVEGPERDRCTPTNWLSGISPPASKVAGLDEDKHPSGNPRVTKPTVRAPIAARTFSADFSNSN